MPCVIVSACLLGTRCRYDGHSKPAGAVQAMVERYRAGGHPIIAVCPEELGDLGTPRPPAELRGGDGHAVLSGDAQVCRTHDGTDVSDAFIRGAHRAHALAPSAQLAVLKARSPSCGVGATWIDGKITPGDGVFAALLRRQGVTLHTDEDID